jgi:hypothetical protein
MVGKSTCHIHEEGRECARCLVDQLWEEYTVNKVGPCGRDSKCRACWKDIRDGRKIDTDPVFHNSFLKWPALELPPINLHNVGKDHSNS